MATDTLPRIAHTKLGLLNLLTLLVLPGIELDTDFNNRIPFAQIELTILPSGVLSFVNPSSPTHQPSPISSFNKRTPIDFQRIMAIPLISQIVERYERYGHETLKVVRDYE